MIELAAFTEHRVALAFSDYLNSRGLSSRVEVEPDRFAIFLQREQDLEQARLELDDFLDNPEDNKYWQSSWHSGSLIKEPLNPRSAGAGGILRNLWQRGGALTLTVVILCVLGFIAFYADPRTVFDALRYPDNPLQAGGEWWRLLTPVFLHFGIMHLVFNLIWWWDLGGLIERTQSRLQLLGVFLVTALASNLWQFQAAGPGFGGLSAVVYGLLGYVWVYPLLNPAVGFRLRKEILYFMIGWLLLGYTGLLDNIIGKMANAAHASGLITGMGLGLVFGLLHRSTARPD